MENMEKIGPTTFQVTKTITHEKVFTHDLNFLFEQKIQIQNQKDREMLHRDAELAEVDGLIAKARELGVKTTEELENSSEGDE